MIFFIISILSILIMGINAGTGRAKNITVYRITPRNYTGMTNFDTGDAQGDVFFGIYELGIPELCQSQSSARLPQCENVPILSIPNFNVYGEFLLEYEDRFGEYNECNPDRTTGIFACKTQENRHGGCWYDNPRFLADFSDVCDKSQCECDYISTTAVGKEPLPFGSHTPLPPKWPDTCKAEFVPYAVSIEDRPIKSLQDTTLADCCTACSESGSGFFGCSGYSYDNTSSVCNLYSHPRHFVKPTTGVTCGFRSSAHSGLLGRIAQFSDIMNGTWYSTEKPGECQEGQVVGKDCAWRMVAQTRNVNSSCVNDNVVNVVIKRNSSCFEGCGPDQHKRSSTCWIDCLFNIITGNEQTNSAMTAAEIVAPFVTSFKTDDPTKGGCPTIPPCPHPCKPPQ